MRYLLNRAKARLSKVPHAFILQLRVYTMAIIRNRVLVIVSFIVFILLFLIRKNRYYDPRLMQEVTGRDNLVLLYRPIGNDISDFLPMHFHLDTIKRIIHSEQLQIGFERRWLLWHVIGSEEDAVIAYLKQQGEKYTQLPFSLKQYSERKPVEEVFKKVADLNRLPDTTLIDSIELLNYYRDKAGYFLSLLSEAEIYNYMISDGFKMSRAKYIIPAPLGVTFTSNCMQAMATVLSAETTSYLAVNVAMNEEESTAPIDVVVGFGRDSVLRFDENVIEARTSIENLHRTLGINARPDPVSLHDDVTVFNPSISLEWTSPVILSTYDLLQGARNGLKLLDDEVMMSLVGYHQVDLMWYNWTILGQEKHLYRTQSGSSALMSLIEELVEMADLALKIKPFSVTHKLQTPPSGDKHDYYTPAPYYWPDPDGDDLPYIIRDGIRVPGTGLYDEKSEQFDRSRLASFVGNTTSLALAWYFTDDHRYAEQAAVFIKKWFIDPTTRMNPNMKFAQIRLNHHKDIDNGGFQSGVIESKDFYFFLDAIRLIKYSGALSNAEYQGVSDWMSQFLHYILEQRQGKNERKSINNHGTYYDLQLAALAAFINNPVLLRHTAERSRARIIQQFAEDGSIPDEMRRPTQLHYMLFSLQGWYSLARVAQRAGVDLWHYIPRRDNHSLPVLQRAAQFTVPYFNSTWTNNQTEIEDMERMIPLYYLAHSVYPNMPVVKQPSLGLYETKPRFNEHDGICLFWNLGLVPNED